MIAATEAPRGRAFVAVSGGLDSTCLARLLAARFPIELAWFDHGWRDGRGDEAFVGALAAEVGAPLHVGRGRPDAAAVASAGPEADARAQRHRFLRQLAGPDDVVFLGHHEDDHLETVLMQLGDGTPHPAGIPRRRGPFRRPLLGVPRAALVDLARCRGWSWREDPTNAGSRRGALRGSPPSPVERRRLLALARAHEPARRAAWGHLESDRRLAVAEGDDWVLLRADLLSLPAPRATALLRDLCSVRSGHRGPGRRALAATLDPRPGARQFPLGAGWSARVEGPNLRLARRALDLEGAAPPSAPFGAPWSGWSLGRRELNAESARARFIDPAAGRDFAVLAPDLGPLTIGPAHPGERLRPFGGSGRRRIRDLLADSGVVRHRRAAWPVVRDAAGTPLWIPGVRQAASHPLAPSAGMATLLYTVASSDPEGTTAREAR